MKQARTYMLNTSLLSIYRSIWYSDSQASHRGDVCCRLLHNCIYNAVNMFLFKNEANCSETQYADGSYSPYIQYTIVTEIRNCCHSAMWRRGNLLPPFREVLCLYGM